MTAAQTVDRLLELLARSEGATLEELSAVAGVAVLSYVVIVAAIPIETVTSPDGELRYRRTVTR